MVTAGRVTGQDLDVLGQGLVRSYRVHGVDGFEDLLAELDGIEAVGSAPRGMREDR